MTFRIRFSLRPKRLRLMLMGIVVGAAMGDAAATLGQVFPLRPSTPSVASVSGAKAQSITRAAAYTIHESELESGTTVREYATPTGLVFAVSWRGPLLPDLNLLLGDYFQTFREEMRQARLAGRRGSSVNMESTALVVRSNGRMRNFFGSAYAPGLVPADVNIKDVLQ